MIQPQGKLNASKYIEDTKTVRLTWTERLLTWPWKPWIRTMQIPKTKWISDKQGGVLCSLETYKEIARARAKRNKPMPKDSVKPKINNLELK